MNAPVQPDIFRDRISHKLAFPIGYEFLREHFGELAGWAGARFWFLANTTIFASEFARILRTQVPYPILSVGHRMEQHSPRYVPAHMEFAVYPVARQLKSVARAALAPELLAILRAFAARERDYDRSVNRVDVLFDPVEVTCRMK